MFGWRARIGYISPSVIEVLPYEFYRFAPDGVGLVSSACAIENWQNDEFEKGLAQVKESAAYLGSRKVDYIIHGGGPLVVMRGKGFEETIIKEIETASGVQATTGVRSAVEALRHIDAHRIVMASPYPPAHDEAMSAYFRAFGFDVVAAEGTNMAFKEIQNQTPQEIYRFARSVVARSPECDTIYLPCPQWQGAQAVKALEEDTGKTVIAYTHANFFCAFRALNIGAPVRGHGKLLASLARD
jgi:maleate isomerase